MTNAASENDFSTQGADPVEIPERIYPNENITIFEDFADSSSDQPPKIDTKKRLAPNRIQQINREITRKIPNIAYEKEKLLEERHNLVLKKYRSSLTNKEERRLVFISWQIDRIEDADKDNPIPKLEEVAERHELFAKQLEILLSKLQRA